jgi:FkbM family methyltransferase
MMPDSVQNCAMSENVHGSVREDLLLGGALRLRQPVAGHRAGTDAVLLAASARSCGPVTIVDLGAGVGTVGLILARRNPEARVILVERDPVCAALARENASLNGLGDRISTICADITAPARALAEVGLTERLADLVVTNPPFLAEGHARASPLASRRAAHVMSQGDSLDRWVKAARRLLRPRGNLVLIHRADALPDILLALRTGFGGAMIRPVHAKADQPAIRVIVSATAQSKAPTGLLPGLVLHESDGRFTSQADAIHRGTGLLD